jgi:hypothetical protein
MNEALVFIPSTENNEKGSVYTLLYEALALGSRETPYNQALFL